VWVSDRAFVGGRRAFIGTKIGGTLNDGLYRQARVGVRSYHLALPRPGTYRLGLRFADDGGAKARQRSFTILAEDRVIVRDLNVLQRVGPHHALRMKRIVVSRDRRLDITFRARRGEPTVSGIRVTRIGPARQLAAPATGPVPIPKLNAQTAPDTQPVTPENATMLSRSTNKQPARAKLSPSRKLLIEHGWDVSTAKEIAADRVRIEALPLDGISVRPEVNPISPVRISAAAAREDLAIMPKMAGVSHNFLLFRMVDDANGRQPHAYDFYDDALWSTISANAAAYAAAAQLSGAFDGIMVDTEYYGQGQNPWDYGSSAVPWSASESEGATPGHSPADAQAQVQRRGKQVMDAIRSQWPAAKVLHFRGAWLSEPKSFYPDRMNGNNVAWANELNGPFVVGFVESALGTSAAVIDGTELYTQRSLRDFENVYNWAKSGLAGAGGRIVPAPGVSAADYAAHITVAQVVYDRYVHADYSPFSAETFGAYTKWALDTSDQYTWLYTENHDWRGTGWPFTAVPQDYLDAVAQARGPSSG